MLLCALILAKLKVLEINWNVLKHFSWLLQSTVGTIVKCGDEGNPIGMASVLNFQRYKGLSAMSDAKKFILENCDEPQKMQLFQKVWNSSLQQKELLFVLHRPVAYSVHSDGWCIYYLHVLIPGEQTGY